MGRRAHKPDATSRKQVEALAAYGIPEPDISRVIGIDPKTKQATAVGPAAGKEE